jgi:diguanylate cyclase (GGDEF)-like protein
VSQPLDLLGAAAYESLHQALAAMWGPAPPSDRPLGDDGRRVVATRFVRRDSCGCPQRGLVITEAQARARFAENTYLQRTLNIQYGLGVELLRTHERDPRELAWLSHTPAVAGCLGLWSEHPTEARIDADTGTDADPLIEVVGTFGADEGSPMAVGGVVPVSSFPPAELFDLADDDAGEIVFVVPVRSKTRDWGLFSAIGTIQSTTPPGREMMNHSGSLLAVALDHTAVLRSLHEQKEQARHAALHDQLTGLPNRALFLDRLRRAVYRAVRHPDHLFAVLFLDLNGFKEVNDTLGHAAGDQLLLHVADRLRELLRSADTAARLGGDEFVVLLDGLPDADAAEFVVARVHEALKDSVDIDGREVRVSVSIGLARSGDVGDDPEQILKQADAAMYRAKTADRQRRGPHRSASSGAGPTMPPAVVAGARRRV